VILGSEFGHIWLEVKVMQKGGIEALAMAMKKHRSSAVVQEEACGAIETLADKNGGNRILIAQQGGLDQAPEPTLLNRN